MTPFELKTIIGKQLAAAGVETPEVDAARIVSDVSGMSELELFFQKDQALAPDRVEKILDFAQRRAKREPLQHILRKAYFRNVVLYVDSRVLVPRPETEILVDYLLDLAPRNGKVLDLGTGSGAIVLPAADERDDLDLTAADISLSALDVARKNAADLKLAERVRFVQSDLWGNLAGEKFDFVAANLPYVSEEDYQTLSPEVKAYDPVLALTAPDSGFLLIEKTAIQLKEHLLPGGKAMFELAPEQAERLSALLRDHGFNTRIVNDLAGRERFVLAEL